MPAQTETGDPLLLTPGPLTTSRSVKAAMLHDWGSRDEAFIRINAEVLARIAALAGASETHVTVPVQGSGTFAVEAMLTCFVPRDGKLLLLVNGAYGHRAAKICAYAGRAHQVLETPEDTPVDLARLDATLAGDRTITHVFVVQCETTSGILNPIAEVAAIARKHGRRLLIDAMSAFGALPLDARQIPFDAMAASSNKCLEGVPGMGFVFIRKAILEACAGNSQSLAMDLYDQQVYMEKTGQWRFTPPTHVVVALSEAIAQFEEEGGQPARLARYTLNYHTLIDGMARLGFMTFLDPAVQAPIIVTFHAPGDARYEFKAFYAAVKKHGFVIYPGKLTQVETFRVGCIGAIGPTEMEQAVQAVELALQDMGIGSGEPAI